MSKENSSLREFEVFKIDLDKNVLWAENEPVDLPIKAVGLLGALIKEVGEVVSKGALLDEVWTDSFVEESVLSQNVYLLRKTFEKYGVDKNLIQTVPRRGYRFTGEVNDVGDDPDVIEESATEPEKIRAVDLKEDSEKTRNGEKVHPDSVSSERNTWILLASAAVGCLFLISLGFWWGSTKRTNTEISSVAVLPLNNLGENEGAKTLSLGLTDSLINRLGSLNRFSVRPLSAVAKYDDSKTDAVSFAKNLNVEAVLEGTIQESDDRIRLNVRLIKVVDGSQLWEGSFNEPKAGILELQDTLSRQLANSLVSRLSKIEDFKLEQKPTENIAAYNAYIKGRYFWNKRTHEDLKKAISYFERAIELDKDFAEAYVSLADSQYLLYDYLWDTSPENPRRAKENLLRALSIKPELARALVTLGYIRTTYDWDWEQAETAFKRALEIEKNLPQAYHRYGVLLVRLRRFSEGQELLAAAKRLDPLSVSINMNYAVSLFFDGKAETAEKYLKETLELDPEFSPARWYLARCYWYQGKRESAIKEIVRTLAASDQAELAARIEKSNGSPRDRMKLLYEDWREQHAKDSLPAQSVAFAASFQEDKELTIPWLEKAVKNRDAWAAWLYSQPEFNFLRDEPRFRALVKEMRFE